MHWFWGALVSLARAVVADGKRSARSAGYARFPHLEIPMASRKQRTGRLWASDESDDEDDRPKAAVASSPTPADTKAAPVRAFAEPDSDSDDHRVKSQGEKQVELLQVRSTQGALRLWTMG